MARPFQIRDYDTPEITASADKKERSLLRRRIREALWIESDPTRLAEYLRTTKNMKYPLADLVRQRNKGA